MFEFFFKYPARVFARGEFVFLASWPVWALIAAVLLAAAGLGAWIWAGRDRATLAIRGWRLGGIWLLQSLLAGLLLLLLWQPALRVATLKPQQNLVAVVIDDSRSMALAETGGTRRELAVKALESGLLTEMQKKFQTRLYRMGGQLERIEKLDQLTAASPATRISDSLKQVAAESASLPIGAVVLLSDGADNSGGIDLETINEIRRQRIPVHTIGLGRERFERDVELTDVQVAPRALADSRLGAEITLRQRGYAKQKARLTVRESGKVLAAEEVTLKGDGVPQTETVLFNAGGAGAKTLEVSLEPLGGEENRGNNTLTRLVNVESTKPRILYLEGEPRWEFKFVRRALDEERSVQLTTMLRTTQNKIYRQGVANPKELEEGFPAKAEELFEFQGVILGGVEVGYLTSAQQELLKQFVDRRGGGLLLMAGRAGLSDGGYATSTFADLLPVTLPDRKNTFHRDPATVELTGPGRESLMLRLDENAEKNVARWKKLPYLANYQEVGAPKPGAVVLAEMLPQGKSRLPLLITQNFGRGRTAVLATAGTWRWQMSQDLADRSHEMFWQQLLRWLVFDTPARVVSSTPRQVLADETRVSLRVEARDKTYLPLADAQVVAHIVGPEGMAAEIELVPEPLAEGVYAATWDAEKPGSYLAEVVVKRGNEEIGRDVFTFRREDGVAENFRAEQNRELLEKVSAQTGGNYYRPDEARRLADEISYSEAGITVRETRDLWNLPIVFLLVLGLKSAEWLLRRKWGAV